MADFLWYQYVLIALLFIWSGIVRSGLGFGGAVFSLPFLLMINNDPLIWLPIISLHLLFFASLTVFNSHKNLKESGQDSEGTINWRYLRYSLAIIIIPKIIGVFGLVTLEPTLLSSIIFVIIALYSLSYIFNINLKSNSKTVDTLLLIIGGYVSGTSLIAAPIIIVVYANHVNRHQLRDTLFVLWFILVSIKIASFVYLKVDLQLIHQLWLLPSAAIGHRIGQLLHKKILESEPIHFFRGLGLVLLLTSILGIVQMNY